MVNVNQDTPRRNGNGSQTFQGLESLRQALTERRSDHGNGRSNGYGEGHGFPSSRKAFNRGLPRRVGSLEQDIKHLDARLEMLKSQVAALETRSMAIPDPLTTARIDNLVEWAGRMEVGLRRVDQRSSRARRKLAVVADQLELQFE